MNNHEILALIHSFIEDAKAIRRRLEEPLDTQTILGDTEACFLTKTGCSYLLFIGELVNALSPEAKAYFSHWLPVGRNVLAHGNNFGLFHQSLNSSTIDSIQRYVTDSMESCERSYNALSKNSALPTGLQVNGEVRRNDFEDKEALVAPALDFCKLLIQMDASLVNNKTIKESSQTTYRMQSLFFLYFFQMEALVSKLTTETPEATICKKDLSSLRAAIAHFTEHKHFEFTGPFTLKNFFKVFYDKHAEEILTHVEKLQIFITPAQAEQPPKAPKSDNKSDLNVIYARTAHQRYIKVFQLKCVKDLIETLWRARSRNPQHPAVDIVSIVKKKIKENLKDFSEQTEKMRSFLQDPNQTETTFKARLHELKTQAASLLQKCKQSDAWSIDHTYLRDAKIQEFVANHLIFFGSQVELTVLFNLPRREQQNLEPSVFSIGHIEQLVFGLNKQAKLSPGLSMEHSVATILSLFEISLQGKRPDLRYVVLPISFEGPLCFFNEFIIKYPNALTHDYSPPNARPYYFFQF